MKENYEINRLREEQVDDALALIRSTFDSAYLIPSIYRAEGIAKFICNELLNPCPNTFYYVLSTENKVLGFAELKPYPETIFLNMIGIDPERKGQGLGSIMLGELSRIFREAGYGTMQLDVFESNTHALQWYLQQGFARQGEKHLMLIDKVIPPKECSILNYAQALAEYNSYGFSILKVANEAGKQYEIGRIQNDLILRSSPDENALTAGSTVLQKMQGEKLYYFTEADRDGDQSLPGRYLDTVLRLKKKL